MRPATDPTHHDRGSKGSVKESLRYVKEAPPTQVRAAVAAAFSTCEGSTTTPFRDLK